jgi:hypothetical protein
MTLSTLLIILLFSLIKANEIWEHLDLSDFSACTIKISYKFTKSVEKLELLNNVDYLFKTGLILTTKICQSRKNVRFISFYK